MNLGLIVNAQGIIFHENFDTIPNGQLPQGWTLYHLIDSASVNWRVSFAPVNSTKGLRHGPFSQWLSIDTVDNYTVTPPIVLTQNNILTFSEKTTKYQPSVSLSNALAGIYISNTGPDPRVHSFTQIHEFDTTQIGSVLSFSVDLSSFGGDTVYLGFKYYALPLTYSYAIDDIIISEPQVDGGLTRIVAPVGTAFPGSTQDIVVELKNYANTIIDSIQIDFSVNGINQPTFSASNLGLGINDSIQLVLGSYPFGTGINDIMAAAIIPNDNNNSNDTTYATYTISPTVDFSIEHIEPEGSFPIVGPQQVKAVIVNNGTVVANTCSIDWWIDNQLQAPYQGTFLNLQPGDSLEITLGQGNYSKGIHNTTAKITNTNDVNPTNDSLSVVSIHGELYEDFEGEFLPEGWTSHYGLKDNILSPIQNWYYEAQAASNYFGTVSDTLFTPALIIDTSDVITFELRMNAFFPTTAFLIAQDLNSGSFIYLDTITSTALGWVQRTVDLSQALGVKRIGFCFLSNSDAGGGSIDLVHSTAARYLPLNDLKVKGLDYGNVARANQNHPIKAIVKNIGQNFVAGTNYNVQLKSDTGVVATLNGVDLAPWSEEQFVFQSIFSNVGVQDLRVEVVFNQDSDTLSNTTDEFRIHIVPENAISETNGAPQYPSQNLPFNGNGSDFTLGSDDLTQVLYLANDLKNGFIYGYELKARNIIEGSRKLPLQIWVGETTASDLSAGWQPFSGLTLVFDDTIVVSGAEQDIYIPFNVPYLYSGNNNLVIQSYQYDAEWPSLATSFYLNGTVGQVRSRFVLEAFTVDPTNPAFTGGTLNDFPYTNFIIDTLTEVSHVYGEVVDMTNSQLLSGAAIEVVNMNFNATTDAQGRFDMPGLPYGNHNFVCEKYGYYVDTLNHDIYTPQDTVDFHLIPRPEVDLIFVVSGSDAPTTGLNGALAELSVYGSYLEYSTSTGIVNFQNVYGDALYVLTISKKGYEDYVLPVELLQTDLDLDTIVLIQEERSAYNAIALDQGNAQDALISWRPPLYGGMFQNRLDNDNVSFSFTNEPNENVWLGNYFPNDDTITLTSADVYFDYYPNAHDFVTVEVFNSNEELLVSSSPFQTFPDSTFVIDIPNITLFDDYYVMVHWQNNPLSTDALAIDLTPGITNYARIKYPGLPIDTLGAYVSGIPHGVFLVRANYMDDENPQLLSNVHYNIRRGLISDYTNAMNWPVLNNAPVFDTLFVDSSWGQVPVGDFVYAIETMYGNSSSEQTFSNVLNSATIGLTENVQVSMILVYPNPANSLVHIENLKKNSNYALLDVNGLRIIDFTPLENKITLDLSRLARGIYFLISESHTPSNTVKIVLN